MRHVFIINPTAGKHDSTAELMGMAKNLAARHGLETECVLTKQPGHAAETARALAQSGGLVRLYACGGDGTINEVANGIAGAENAAMTCIPVGTGNDFLKNFGEMGRLFSEAENLWDGPQISLDAIDCNGRLALTVACSGLDAQVADDVHKYGDFPLMAGQGAYIASLAVNFFSKSYSHRWTVELEGTGGIHSGGCVQGAVLWRGIYSRAGRPDGRRCAEHCAGTEGGAGEISAAGGGIR